ncbi:hypothetical protein [Aquimarina agarivorans]|uniref:hypothetical protein n=1 Tax=Aquimarina agarivorans TaxID=980584 RepID=UPI000248E9F1|nr:hypothetical protein [Aquimarina agarivorans]
MINTLFQKKTLFTENQLKQIGLYDMIENLFQHEIISKPCGINWHLIEKQNHWLYKRSCNTFRFKQGVKLEPRKHECLMYFTALLRSFDG